MAEIMMICGESPNVRMVDISEYNPTIEDYRTGRIAVSLFYYFLVGLCKRFEKYPSESEYIDMSKQQNGKQ